ncbi:hypothetical protein PanWU01x14_065690 [Parasponia andersonii]|uniref:Uncharacterized protein n=1 Tax=Parasponia andersonii TaxID=3476 RepID=A0A2P5DGW8_PARAD|nr:hypothetical protein PanWU01x14_065690 [Parasponia andersonii]
MSADDITCLCQALKIEEGEDSIVGLDKEIFPVGKRNLDLCLVEKIVRNRGSSVAKSPRKYVVRIFGNWRVDLGMNKVHYYSPPASASLRAPPTNQPTNQESNNLPSISSRKYLLPCSNNSPALRLG